MAMPTFVQKVETLVLYLKLNISRRPFFKWRYQFAFGNHRIKKCTISSFAGEFVAEKPESLPSIDAAQMQLLHPTLDCKTPVP
jgi:hypothetical protein